MTFCLSLEQQEAFDAALLALAACKRAFGRDLTPGFVGEIYAALAYDLRLFKKPNEPGADGIDADGKRYEIKTRRAQNVDFASSFAFDFAVLVNVDAAYAQVGLWRLGVQDVKGICTWRADFGKHQVTQQKFKDTAEAAALAAQER